MSTVEPWAYPDHKQFERVPSLSEVDKTDRKAVYAARNQKIRDDWVKAMEARIIKEKLDECYRTEGVNHYQSCRHLADMYFEALKTNKVEGFRKHT
ncbi:hypothetical protein G6F70_001286 [Rhizopus microsporus]|uniref:NADH-ubiquinone oxidoreductase 12 kDa subunit mitochondrial n=1 Tax=Rhizopus microsporus ATCC 52813 TaxID=1340429 RepID=A0A2G4SL49_RHIZD|nr:uncharacterized protein RHIMIDRAFT_240579 [Rhizopus microsporus ATCC 52813]KAG1180350.1 hypothetical protein G6F71_000264 [Rhizopus microsporus]KAG1203561.1 hypothetical protein G6F70_001286 [Rhizopus microsporus]KAG1215218.1 hypothetical protein G6F69_001224 [Rhizopus microsporus]KAG1237824.1 hypothetical protein G6F67_000917 [Rhizopus microsporus]KAG1265477.1 hypothetical protein G6F68_003531 [Rhizopus microsporus]